MSECRENNPVMATATIAAIVHQPDLVIRGS